LFSLIGFILAGDVWICKPSGLNQGKGIYLVREIDELKEKFNEIDSDKKKQVSFKPMKRIIQRFVSSFQLDLFKFKFLCKIVI
jgi:phosphoribosylamine-glycine ligase